MEGDFDDVPTGNCDIPDTSAVLREVVGNLGLEKNLLDLEILSSDVYRPAKTGNKCRQQLLAHAIVNVCSQYLYS